MFFARYKTEVIAPNKALPGRDQPPFAVPDYHAVLGTPLQHPFPERMEVAYFGFGCFWGAERMFWQVDGVYTTAVGYQGGYTTNPTYHEVCSGRTGHAEAVMVVYDLEKVSYQALLKVFWEAHNPTQGMRQGNDRGTQYRSAIYTITDEQQRAATASRDAYEKDLRGAGHGSITTEIAPAGPFYYAEEYHQQYLHRVPNGYCGLNGTGVSCSVGLAVEADPQGEAKDRAADDLPGTDAEWRKRLTPEQYAVLRQAGTERPFSNKYVDIDDDGLYRCAACKDVLFDSHAKYHSGTGWPSFTEAVSPDAVELVEDHSHGAIRTEVRCARCRSHLGHLFTDGPREAGGLRYCLNSVALELRER